MTTQIPQEFIQSIARERGVTNAELETVFMALEGQSTATIATQLAISDIAVRKRLGEVYKKFNIGGSGPGKLAELKHQLLFLHQNLEPNRSSSTQMVTLSPTNKGHSTPASITPQRRQDWGDAPDILSFHGRDDEMEKLEQWIVNDNCRIVAILGLAGIGKTSLSVEVAKQIADKFDFVMWRSLRHAPSFDDFINNLVQLFLPANKMDFQETTARKINRIFEYLRKYRCLLVLDDWETILQPGILAGNYQLEYQGYREFIQQFGQVIHQSSAILVSNEAPAELSWLLGSKVRIFKPEGTEAIAKAIFKDKGVTATDKDWKELLKRYRDNLLALKIVAATITEFFGGNTANFLKATALYSNDKIDNWLGQQIGRLSMVEKEIIYWLTLERTPVSLGQVREDVYHLSFSEIVKNLESLEWRSLIEKTTESGETNFTLQPLVMRYVTETLVNEITEELRLFANKPSLDVLKSLKTYDLMLQRGKKVSIKELQTLGVIKSIDQNLQALFIRTSGYDQLRNTLNQMAGMLADKSPKEIGYAADNVKALLEIID